MTRFRRSSAFVTISVPSSSGLGRLVLIQKIAGSTPAGITRIKRRLHRSLILILLILVSVESAQRVRPPQADSEL